MWWGPAMHASQVAEGMRLGEGGVDSQPRTGRERAAGRRQWGQSARRAVGVQAGGREGGRAGGREGGSASAAGRGGGEADRQSGSAGGVRSTPRSPPPPAGQAALRCVEEVAVGSRGAPPPPPTYLQLPWEGAGGGGGGKLWLWC